MSRAVRPKQLFACNRGGAIVVNTAGVVAVDSDGKPVTHRPTGFVAGSWFEEPKNHRNRKENSTYEKKLKTITFDGGPQILGDKEHEFP